MFTAAFQRFLSIIRLTSNVFQPLAEPCILLTTIDSNQLHAEYDRENDDYKAHRVIQAFDTAQFIEATRNAAVLQVLAGDLNSEPGDLAYRTLLSVAGLTDACSSPGTGTNECAHNAYTSTAAAQKLPAGKRIDYVLYNGGGGGATRQHAVDVVYTLPLVRQLAAGDGRTISFSDHEAVLAQFRVHDAPAPAQRADGANNAADGRQLFERLRNDLSDCIHLCDETLKLLHAHRTFYLAAAAAAIVVLATIMDASAPYGCRWLFVGMRVALSGVVLFALFMATLWNRMEANAVLGGRTAMQIALQMTTQAAWTGAPAEAGAGPADAAGVE